MCGSCDRRFAPVRDAFASNFTDRGELGAAVCLSVGGHTVVDLWSGWADGARSRLWQEDTLVNVFSIGKAVSTVCVARLVDRGVVDWDDPVARYWPEFGASGDGKDAITLRQMLSHQAGLPAVRHPLPEDAMFRPDLMEAALAAEAPWWVPGTAHGYHVNTFGYLVGGLVRRVTGETLGRLLRDEVAGPLGADFHIGLPFAEHERVAEFQWPITPADGGAGAPLEGVALEGAALMSNNAYRNPVGLSGAGVINTPEWRMAEIPSTNGHATARGVARIFEALTLGGAVDGVALVSGEALEACTAEQVYGEDLVLQRPSRFGIGFQLTQAERPLGPNPGAFGHFGAGGSLGYADPAAGVAFGYVINTLGPRWQNPRNRALIDSIYESLG